ncbi:MAG TPA: methyltransferase domain-containing protein [Solirubrobacteraceae bacterium]|nr:methyltransferase domain-containing protein [Solirubrobacteraceae bacterium]
MSGTASGRDAADRGAPRLERADQLYGRLLASIAAGDAVGDARLRLGDGRTSRLALERWLAPVDRADRAALTLALDPVLDIGCGPGRHVAALAASGRVALGIDLSPAAVRIARERGADAILRDVFADVPRKGWWGSALLLDGNIGIGSRPQTLLARAAALVRPGGAVVVETGPPHQPLQRRRVRLEAGGTVSPWFGWATVGARALTPLAHAAGLRRGQVVACGDRWFVRLERPR